MRGDGSGGLRSVEVARGLVEPFGAVARQAESERRISDGSIKALIDSGLMTMLLPTQMGGAGSSIGDLCDVSRVLARGCTSTAWVHAFYAIHNWMMVRCSDEVRSELFGERGFILAPAALAPSGNAKVVDGGYSLTGHWKWGTGIDHADWVMLTGIAPENNDMSDVRMFVVRVDEVERVDVWHTDGMRATGSHDIVVKDVFVPKHRAISAQEFFEGSPASVAPFGDARFNLPLVSVFSLVAAAPALGTAEAAMESFVGRITERVLAFTIGKKAIDNQAQRIHVGDARIRLDAVIALFEREVAALDAHLNDPRPLSTADRARTRAVAAHVVGESRRIVADVCAAAGASIHDLANPMQRNQRDINTLCGHVMFDEDAARDLVGRAELGMDFPPGSMV